MLGTLTKYLRTGSWLLVGKQDDPENYRPIDLTSPLSKIMEMFIKDSSSREIKGRNIINIGLCKIGLVNRNLFSPSDYKFD